MLSFTRSRPMWTSIVRLVPVSGSPHTSLASASRGDDLVGSGGQHGQQSVLGRGELQDGVAER